MGQIGLRAMVSLLLPVSLFLRRYENFLSALQYVHIILDYGASVCSVLTLEFSETLWSPDGGAPVLGR